MQTISLKRGLIYIVLLITTVALAIGFSINLFSQVSQYRQTLLRS